MNKTNDASTTPGLNGNLSDLSDLGARQMESLVEAQATLANRIQEAAAGWMKRVEVETVLTADLANKLTNSRSFTDVAAAWQDWSNRRIALAGEDTKRAMQDARVFVAVAFADAGAARGDESWPDT